MSKAIAFSRTLLVAPRPHPVEIARSAIVLGCGAALTLAGVALPL